jgi:hypothetical protein
MELYYQNHQIFEVSNQGVKSTSQLSSQNSPKSTHHLIKLQLLLKEKKNKKAKIKKCFYSPKLNHALPSVHKTIDKEQVKEG